MVGIHDPQSSSSAKGTTGTSQDSQTNTPPSSIVLQWPSIRITRPSQGQYTPKVDERCISYCTQTSAGRAAGKEPRCRALCIRHIFAHEVRKMSSTSVIPNSNTKQDSTPSPEDRKIPLPPEGQPGPEAVQDALKEVSSTGRRPEEQVRYWKEGWYLWMSSSRWAIQEKFDLMMRDLGWQASWVQTRERRKKQWIEAQKEQEHRVNTGVGEGRREPSDGSEAVAPAPAVPSTTNPNSQPSLGQRRNIPPYISASSESFLISLPPPDLPLAHEFRELLAPSVKLVGLLRESLVTGQQRELASRVLETAQSSRPFQLASNVVSKMWEKWKKGPPEDST